MSCLFVGELIGTSLRDRNDVIDDVLARVEVRQAVVDLAAADVTRGLRAGDGSTVTVANGAVAWCAHHASHLLGVRNLLRMNPPRAALLNDSSLLDR